MKGEGNHQYGLKGEKNSSFKGDVTMRNGYLFEYCPNHPFCDECGRVRQHRLVAEKYLLSDYNSVVIDGVRYLNPEFEVHHINFVKHDNNIENLIVLTKSQHITIHNQIDKIGRDENGRFKSNDKE